MISMSEEKEETAATPFSLKNAGSGFEGRSSDIFGGLDVLERKHISHEQNRTDLDDFADLRHDDDNDDLPNRSSFVTTIGPSATESLWQRKTDGNQQGNRDCFTNPDDDVQGTTEVGIHSDKKRDSDDAFERGGRPKSEGTPTLFRRPSGRPPGRCQNQRKRVADHGKGCQSWTHYSLEDVKGSDMSEKSNTQAALAFLDEQRKLREKQEEEMSLGEEEAFDVRSAACSKGLFSFTKRSKTDKSSSISDKDKSAASKDKFDRDQSSAAEADRPDTEETEGAAEEESVELRFSSTKDDATKASFKSRKGIKRNIRTRDDDD